MTPETVYYLLWLITVSVGAYYLGVSDGKAVRKNTRENPAPQSENSDLKPESSSLVLSHRFPPSVPPRILPPDVTPCGHLSTDKFGRCENCGAMFSKWRPEELGTVIKEEAVERQTKKWVLLADKPDSPKLIN